MSNPLTWMNNWVQSLQQLNQTLQTVSALQDQLTQDPTLVTRYFALTGVGPGVPRTDIVAQDVTNASSAVTQVLFSYNTGTPTQKSFIYKLFP